MRGLNNIQSAEYECLTCSIALQTKKKPCRQKTVLLKTGTELNSTIWDCFKVYKIDTDLGKKVIQIGSLV